MSAPAGREPVACTAAERRRAGTAGSRVPARSRLRRPAALLAAVLTLALAVPTADAQELIAGGEASVSPSITLSPRLPDRILPALRTEYRALMAVYGDLAELSARLDLWHETPVPGASALEAAGVALDELRLTIYGGSTLLLDVGRFRYQPGRALLISPNNYYTTLQFDRLIRGDLEGATRANTLATARLFLGEHYVSVAFMPSPNVPQLVEPDSIWLPRLPISSTLTDPELSQDPVVLGERFAEPTRPLTERRPLYERVSGGIEAGTTLGLVDLSLLYYHGIDPAPVPRARIELPGEEPGTYDLYLAPEEAVIDSFGFVAEAFLGPATLWLDAALMPRRALATTTIDPATLQTALVTAPTLTGVLGAGYRLSQPNLLLFAEYYAGHAFLSADDAGETVLMPTLASHLALSSSLTLGPEARWSLTAAGVLAVPESFALADASAVVTAEAAYAASDALRVSLSAPLFVGGQRSALGQYGDIYTVVGSVRYRF